MAINLSDSQKSQVLAKPTILGQIGEYFKLLSTNIDTNKIDVSNVKTINGHSIIGTGDISASSLGITAQDVVGSLDLTSVASNIVATTDLTYDIGSSVSSWNNIYAKSLILNGSDINSTFLKGNQSITVSGDATGSGNTAISLTLANSGVSAGTYKSVTVDAKGRVTAGSNPTTLAGYGITDAQTALTAGTNITISGGVISANDSSVGWSEITSKPTTLAGYGITDVYTKTQTDSAISSAVAVVVNAAPASLDTLGEIATQLANDENLATALTNYVATKAPLASPALTGTPTAPTATAGTSTTQLATTAFVSTAVSTAVPAQASNSGKFLTTNGTATSWVSPKEVIAVTDMSDVSVTSPITGQKLVYNGTAWVNDQADFVENNQTISYNYTVPAGRNAQICGPIAVANGYQVQISNGSRLVVL